MTMLEYLATTANIADLICGDDERPISLQDSTFDNKPSWDSQKGGGFDNRPGWDNWDKKNKK